MPTIIGDAYVDINARDGGFRKDVERIVKGIDDVIIPVGADTNPAERAISKLLDDLTVFEDFKFNVNLVTSAAEKVLDNFLDEIQGVEALINVQVDEESLYSQWDEILGSLSDSGDGGLDLDIGLNASIDLDSDILDDLVSDLSDNDFSAFVTVEPDQESVIQTIQDIEEALQAADFSVEVQVSAALDKPSVVKTAAEAEAIAEGEQATIDFFANLVSAAAEGELVKLTRPRTVQIIPVVAKKYISGLSNRISYALSSDDNPLVNMFRDPALKNAITGFGIATAGILDPRRIKENITSIMADFEGIAVNTATSAVKMVAMAGAAASAAGFASNLVTDIAQIPGLLAAAPAGFAFMKTVTSTWGTVWQGFSKAMSYDTAEFEKNLEKIPPAIHRSATAVHEFSKSLQDVITMNYWGIMDSQMSDFLTHMQLPLNAALGNISIELANITGEVLDLIVQFERTGKFKNTFDNFAQTLRNLNPAISSVTDVFLNMINAGSDRLPEFADWISKISEDFNEWMNTAIDTGKFDFWIDNAVDSIQNLGSVIGSVSGILGEIGSAAEQAGSGGLQELAGGFEAVHNWVRDPMVYMNLVNVFRDANTAFKEMADGAMNVLSSLWDESDRLGDIAVIVGETVGTLFDHVANALDNSGALEGFQNLVEGVREGVSEIGPGIESLGNIFGSLGTMFGTLLSSMAPGVNIMLDTIDGFLQNMLDGWVKLNPVMNDAFEILTTAISGPIKGFGSLLGTIAEALSYLPAPVLAAGIAFGGLVGPGGVLISLINILAGTNFNTPIENFKQLGSGAAISAEGVTKFKNAWSGLQTSVFNTAVAAASADKLFDGVRRGGETSLDPAKNAVDRYVIHSRDKLGNSDGIWNGFKNSASNAFIGARVYADDFATHIRSTTSRSWDGIKTASSNAFTGARQYADSFSNYVYSTTLGSKITAGFDNVHTAGSRAFGNVKRVAETIPGVLRNIGAVGSAAFSAMMGPLGLIVGLIGSVVFTSWQDGIQKAEQSVKYFADSWDPVTQSVKDTDEAIKQLDTRLIQIKDPKGFGDFKNTLEDLNIDVRDFSQRLLDLDNASLSRLEGQFNNVRSEFSNFGTSVKDAVGMMTDEMVALTGKSREELESMNRVEFNELISGIDKITTEMKEGRESAETFQSTLDSLNTDKFTLVSDSFADFAVKADQGVRDALVRANEQASTLDDNFKTLESTTSTVSDKINAMKSNMELMNLDTSAWNDPFEKLWQNADKSKDAFAELSTAMEGIHGNQLVTITESFDGARHAALNFGDGVGQASSKLNGIMKDSSSSIKDAFVSAFDQARESGMSMADATSTALGSVKGPIENLKQSLREIGIPEDQITALMDTFGILEEDLTKSIDVKGAEEAKRDIINVELAAQAIANQDWEAYLKFNTMDADDALTKFVGRSSSVDDVKAKLNLETQQAEDLLMQMQMSETHLMAVVDTDTIDFETKKRLLEQERIRIDAEIKAKGETEQLKTERQSLQDALQALELQVEGKTDQIPTAVEQAKQMASGTEIKIPLGANSQKFLEDYQSTITQANANGKATITLDGNTVPFDTKSSAAIAHILSQNPQLAVDANTALAEAQTGQFKASTEAGKVSINLGANATPANVDVDSFLTNTSAKTATANVTATTAQADANFQGFAQKVTTTPLAAQIGASAAQAYGESDSLANYVNTMVMRPTVDANTQPAIGSAASAAQTISSTPVSMSIGGTAQPAITAGQQAANTIGSTPASMTIGGENSPVMGAVREAAGAAGEGAVFPINFDLGQLEHMRGVLRYYQSTTINISAAVQMGGLEHLVGVINANKNHTIRVSVSADLGPVSNLSSAIRNVPERTVPLRANVSQALSDVASVVSRIKNVPDKKFRLHTDIGQALTDIRSVVNRIQAVPDKQFTIKTDIGQVLTDIKSVVSRIQAIPDKEFTIRANTSPAMSGIDSVNNRSVRDKTSTITTYLRDVRLADGGVIGPVKRYANGGMDKAHQSIRMQSFAGGSENHVAQIARGGWPYRVWAEPETGGEAYIPLAQAKRRRSTEILEQVAKHFGYSLVQSFSSGGIFSNTVRKRGVQKFASGGTTLVERRNQFASDLAQVFNSFESSLRNIFLEKKTPVVEAINSMTKSLNEAISKNGSANPTLRSRAIVARNNIERNSRISSLWKPGVNAGLRYLDNNISSSGTIRRGSGITLADIEAGISRTQTRLNDAMKHAESLRQAHSQVMDNIASKMREPFSLSNAFAMARETYTPVSLSMVTAHAKRIVDNNNKFRRRLKDMYLKGFPASFIQEVASLGAEEGVLVAEELLKAPPADIKDFKQAYADVERTSLGVGSQVADTMYRQGIFAADGVVNGLEGRLSELEKAGKILADTLIKSFKSALQIKSPSRVMMGLGAFTGEGLAIGIVAQSGLVSDAMDQLSDVVSNSSISDIEIPSIDSNTTPSRKKSIRLERRNDGTIEAGHKTENVINYNFFEGSIVFEAKDLDEVRGLEGFIKMLRVESRRKGVRK